MHLDKKKCYLFNPQVHDIDPKCGVQLLRNRLTIGLAKIDDKYFAIQVNKKKPLLHSIIDAVMKSGQFQIP